ncbi:MAG TPA: IPT/TIG domain-containing protein [Thermoanaerobaculia bacterium]|nr:IPT/TIG domain-containing protein [Thermoanaerobaculia bacterium]
MRRIAIALILAAAVVGIHACAADAPTAPKPGAGGGTTSSAVSVQLVASDANPKAGTCTLIEAFVTLNGAAVPDGTTVNFTTDFGAFGQNGLGLVSVVTTNGTATTALCGPGAGSAKVKGTATIQGKTNSGTVTVNFQPSSATLPFVSFCNPSFGPKEGGTTLTLNGGRFFGSPSTTRVVFTVNGVAKDGIVTAVTSTAITVSTPGFSEIGSPSAQAAISLILGTNEPAPVTLSLPSCFTYGSVTQGTPTVTALLPSSGSNEGNTRVTIVGSGFSSTGVQVFFGTVEASVVSVSYNQVVALSPPASGAGSANLNASVAVTVKNIDSGIVSNASVNYQYTTKVKITSWNNNFQPLGGPYSPVTIFGQGFQAPVAVSLASWAAIVQSVSATEIVVIPGPAVPSGCSDITGGISVVNIDTGDGDSQGSFTYHALKPTISSVSPANSCPSGAPCPNGGTGGIPVDITGTLFPPTVASTLVKFGAASAFVNSVSATDVNVTAPPTTAAAPTCTGSNPAGTPQAAATVDVSVTDTDTQCSVVATQAFQYLLPCVVPAP